METVAMFGGAVQSVVAKRLTVDDVAPGGGL